MKNIVIVSTVSPNAEPRGAILRLQNLIKTYETQIDCIVVLGFQKKPVEFFRDIKIIYLIPNKFDWIYILLGLIFKPITNAIYFRGSLGEYVSDNQRVLFHLIRSYQDLNTSETTIDICESLAENFRQRALFYSWLRLKKYFLLYESFRLKKLEDKIIKNKDIHKILISKNDRLYSDTPNITIIPNKFKLLKQTKTIKFMDTKFVFIGHIDYEPNLLSLIKCSKMLKRINSNFRISAVGRCSDSTAGILEKYRNIDIHGFVNDPSLILSDGNAGLAIMEIGTGQQNKVFDYISYGVPPIVSSNVQSAYPGQPPFLIADNFDELKQAIKFLSFHDNRIDYIQKCRSYIEQPV